ncbi:hypothetical protein RclHR1_14700005 [Rhizophagus clarus]|uniref:Uncharacterized protein n=1 Tax=Rhizophagus clarus TaxID=94130 RepID=A0A2Z6QDF3_9GLOM|nr:hypothetical protein RclHR1_14700005 [Rhizophagus clarus]
MGRHGTDQVQDVIYSTAHEKQLVHDSLSLTLESLEVFIEKSNWYPNFRNRRQIHNKGLPNENGVAWDYKDATLTQSLILTGMMGKTPSPIVRDYIHKEFYSWIDHAIINVTNCPRDLAHLLIDIDKALVGDGQKIIKDTDIFLRDKPEPKPESMISLFSSIQKFDHTNKKRSKLLENKKFDELDIPGFKGDWEKGKEKLEAIKAMYYPEYNNYYSYSQQETQYGESMEIEYQGYQSLK